MPTLTLEKLAAIHEVLWGDAPETRRSDADVAAMMTPGLHRVAPRLYLKVAPSKAGGVTRSWIYRYQRDGRTHHMGLGGYPRTSVDNAIGKVAYLRGECFDPLSVQREVRRRRRAGEPIPGRWDSIF